MRKNFFRTFIAAVLICSMLTVPAFAEAAVVTGSEVNMRSGPGMNYGVVDCLPLNASVTVTDRSNGDWYAIEYNGQSGFMSSRYLKISEGEISAEIVGSTDYGDAAYINAMYVRFRSGPSSGSSILGEYNKGKEIRTFGISGDWTACVIDGQSGYVYSQYVSSSNPGSSNDTYYEDDYVGDSDGIVVTIPGTVEQTPEPTPVPTPEPDGDITVIIPSETVQPTPEPTPAPTAPPVTVEPVDQTAATIDGDYVRFRTGPGTSYGIIGSYNRGKAVGVTGVSGDWTACVIDGQSGYVYSQYIKYNTTQETPVEPEQGGDLDVEIDDTPVVTPTESKSGYIVGNNVRFRSGPSMSSGVIGELFYGNNVTITGVSGDWTAVTFNGKAGYVYSQYVKEGQYSHVSSGGSDLGRQIADYALQFVGYNYSWGGKSPSTGFDCSGLMYYVYQQFGYTLNRVADDQARNGVHVDHSDIQPGDILCFYSGGSYVGHVGMYIGDNKFVHAANSISGVIISDLSGYYASRGYEARRII